MAIGKRSVAIAATCCTLAIAWLVSAQDRATNGREESVAGVWSGSIDLSIDEIAFTVELQQTDGQWRGVVSIPEQNIHEAPARNIAVGRQLSFDVAQSGLNFRGELQADGTISCRLSRGSRALLCKLARGSKSPSVSSAKLTPGQVDGLPSERASVASTGDPNIAYALQPPTDVVAKLNEQLDAGGVTLKFAADNGYLTSVLDALQIPADSQMVVFSQTSVQASFINPATPRALYFDDKVSVGFIKNAPLLEIAAHDPTQGVVFYTLDQQPQQRPRFTRRDTCLSCHVSHNSMDVPGFLLRSVITGIDGRAYNALGNRYADDRTPFVDRWGGWFVTGTAGGNHLGNRVFTSTGSEVRPLVPTGTAPLRTLHEAYPSRFSDVVALLVFQHQARLSNLLTRTGWDARVGRHSAATVEQSELYRRLLGNDARELVDALLFVDEVPLPGTVVASSTFSKTFASKGPSDDAGRSLRQFDLSRRLFRYPCSYMIYSAAFDALPSDARDAVYSRLWAVLSGSETDPRYGRLTVQDRRAVVEILQATKSGLPSYFR